MLSGFSGCFIKPDFVTLTSGTNRAALIRAGKFTHNALCGVSTSERVYSDCDGSITPRLQTNSRPCVHADISEVTKD